MIVVFDVDGTLVDMRGLHAHALVSVLGKYGVKIREEDAEEASKQSLSLFLLKILPKELWGKMTEII